MGPSGSNGSVLREPTLVLNRSWVPIHTTTVRHALTLLCKDAASVIQPETYEVHSFDSWQRMRPGEEEPRIGCVRFSIRVPEVIVLSGYDRIPRKRVPFTRRNLYRRDDNTCQYCGERAPADRLSIDHVVPRSRGGRNSWDNCVLACVRCNIRKGDRPPEAAGMRLRSRPREPEWSPCLGIRPVKRKDSWRRFVSPRQWATA